MIRVGFIIRDNVWMGGLNYFRNLFNAVYDMPERQLDFVIFTGSKVQNSLFNGFPPVEIVKTQYLDRFHPKWILHKFGQYIGYDLFLEQMLKKHRVDLLSHDMYLSSQSSVPTLGWIPDFQCMHLPNLFTKREVIMNKRRFALMAKLCTTVLLSSYDAEKDFMELYPKYKFKSKVLQFVVRPSYSTNEISIQELENKYNFKGKYFFVPNQFWAHKNHKVIIDALHILKQKNIQVLLLATGDTKDYRNPNYFETLMMHVKECGVNDMFLVFGKVPYADVISLMKNSLSVINPSLFEGWSTTVEETKSLGKQIVLSDIPIHKEQNPLGGFYFDPHNPNALAELLEEIWFCNKSDIQERELVRFAKKELQTRWQSFANQYQKIAFETLKELK